MKPGSNTGLGLRKGTWTAEEDMLLKNCIEKYGEGKWHLVPLKAGLNRCRKSCRLRWLNYLSPNLKRGNFGEDEVDLILRLHKLLGNRWSLIAGRIPGRTANDVKNYWNSRLRTRSKNQNKESRAHESLQDTIVTIYKPQPLTFSKTVKCYMGDNPHIVAHDGGSQIRSSDDGDNNFNVSLGLISSPNVLDDKINEYIDDLFDDSEKEMGDQNGWSFGVSTTRETINVVEQFDFPIDEVMWDLIDKDRL